jgi:hypothetical protein
METELALKVPTASEIKPRKLRSPCVFVNRRLVLEWRLDGFFSNKSRVTTQSRPPTNANLAVERFDLPFDGRVKLEPQ